MLVAIVAARGEKLNRLRTLGSWRSAFALFVYAAGFSFAYVSVPTASGALLLFGAVQATMIGNALWVGERLRMVQVAGLLIASSGLVALLLPNVSTVSAVPLPGALMMIGAGVAWGIYSLRAKGVQDPTGVTAGNFVRALPFAAVLGTALLFLSTSMSPTMLTTMLPAAVLDRSGVLYAIASGAITSGLGYAIWYAALRGLKSSTAATVQLSAPMLAAIGGAVFLGEALTLHLLLTSAAILGGIALFIWSAARAK